MERLKFSVPPRQAVCLEGDGTQTMARGGDPGRTPLHSRIGNNASQKRRLILTLGLALGFCFAMIPQAKAAFIGDYSLSKSTLINTDLVPNAATNGFVTTNDNGQSIVLTGGNSGSGLPGLTDLLFTATAAGPVKFFYTYHSLDFPTFDYAGYLLANAFTQLADSDGQFGSAMFTVSRGQTFGFRVGTKDNTNEPGILTVSDFSAPSAGGTIPEPATGLMMFVVTVATIAARRCMSQTKRQEGKTR